MKQRRIYGDKVRAVLSKFDGGSESMDLLFQRSKDKSDFQTTIEASIYAKEDYRHASMSIHGVEEIDNGTWKQLNDTGTEVKTIRIKTDDKYRPIEITLFREMK